MHEFFYWGPAQSTTDQRSLDFSNHFAVLSLFRQLTKTNDNIGKKQMIPSDRSYLADIFALFISQILP